jgi:ABC-type molybdate transport system substrate-binding protein
MRLRMLAATACLGLLVQLVPTAVSKAAEIELLCAIALQQLMENLGPKFEEATKHKLTTTIAPLGAALKRLEGGEVYDLVILPQRGVDGLAGKSSRALRLLLLSHA